MKNELYYFNQYDLTDYKEELENKLFTFGQLYEIFRDIFQSDLINSGDTETTFESWLYDNLKMGLIVLIDEESITIPKKYSLTCVSCLPVELSNLITEKITNNYGYLIEDDFFTILENVLCEKVANITNTINIEFIHEA